MSRSALARTARLPLILALLGWLPLACEPPAAPHPAPPAPGQSSAVGDRPSESREASNQQLRSELFLSSRERKLRVEQTLSRELETTLSAAPRVERARVHLTLPPPESLLSPAPREPAKGFVWIQHSRGVPPWQEREVRGLLAAAVDGLTPERITVVFREVEASSPTSQAPTLQAPTLQAEPAWETVGPLRVERESAPLLRWLLGAFSVSGLLLVAGLVRLWWRLRFLPLPTDSTGAWTTRSRVPPAS